MTWRGFYPTTDTFPSVGETWCAKDDPLGWVTVTELWKRIEGDLRIIYVPVGGLPGVTFHCDPDHFEKHFDLQEVWL